MKTITTIIFIALAAASCDSNTAKVAQSDGGDRVGTTTVLETATISITASDAGVEDASTDHD